MAVQADRIAASFILNFRMPDRLSILPNPNIRFWHDPLSRNRRALNRLNHVLADPESKCFRNHDAAIFLLMIFQHGDDCSSTGNGGSV